MDSRKSIPPISRQYKAKAMNLAAIEMSLRKDEHIALRHGVVVADGKVVCADAVIIADDSGDITGWADNEIPICVFDAQQ